MKKLLSALLTVTSLQCSIGSDIYLKNVTPSGPISSSAKVLGVTNDFNTRLIPVSEIIRLSANNVSVSDLHTLYVEDYGAVPYIPITLTSSSTLDASLVPGSGCIERCLNGSS